MELWVEIEGFPLYKVSNEGRVMNEATGRILRESYNKGGVAKVGLIELGIQHSRSLSVLVATAFVSGRSDIFNTPIHLDGDHTNNRAENLMWRPRWFAWKFSRQFEHDREHQERGPLIDIESGRAYLTFLDAASTHGLLFEDIWRSMVYKVRTFPTKQLFRMLN